VLRCSSPVCATNTTSAEVGELARGLDEANAVVIFPEGGNFTPARRERAIRSLREKGLDEQAGQAELMKHMLPPRPGGVQAALASAPEAARSEPPVVRKRLGSRLG
jgi:1-acyl-sn-glycerol-3-phosphate acyltransferase